MKIMGTHDPKAVSFTEEKATILQEDLDWIKDLVKNIRNTHDPAIVRQAEHDFHEEMVMRYGGKGAGALLLSVWKMTKNETVR